MNYWIFTVAAHKSDSESYTAREIYQRRMQDRFWGLGERTANRKNIRQGDQVVYYIAKPEMAFGGTASLASDSVELNADQRSTLSHGSPFYTTEYGVLLDHIDIWETAHAIAPIASSLKFIANPLQWGTYLQGGIRQITAADYATIVNRSNAKQPRNTPEELEAQSNFALEAHLEEFIAHNWPIIPWGAPLELYRDGDQTGRQFPADTWSIDFLAIDPRANELVVIELKRAQTSDATVGQVLRYINWVRENVAADGQNVRGIIVAGAIDEALRYSARGLSDVTVKTYEVTFALKGVQL